MAEQLLRLIVDGGIKLVTALKNVKTNKKDAHKLAEHIALVESLCTDVIPRHEDGRRIGRDPKVILAMSRMKDALEEAEREVDRYVKRGFLFQLVNVDAMTRKLAGLRQDIKDVMDVSLHATVNETNKDVKENKHMLQGLGNKIDMIPYLIDELNKDTSVVVAKQQQVLTQIQLRTRQREDTALVSRAMSVPFGVAAVLLRHLNWDPERVQDEWLQHGDKLRKAVGLPSSSSSRLGWGPISQDGRERSSCNICCGAGTTTMVSAGCSHYYCKACWRRYISLEVRKGGLQCLSLRCPDPSCQMPVIEELIDMVELNDRDRELYTMSARCSYVDNSGGRIKWCPGPNCGSAIEFLGGAGASSSADNDVMVVACCDLKHSFCWSCGEEPHRPVSCDTACTWLDTITPREDWVLVFIKRCPKCRKFIENSMNTNKVTCSAPCGHQFCWTCLQPLGGSNHHTATCSAYRSWAVLLVKLCRKQNVVVSVPPCILNPETLEWERQAMLTRQREHQKAVASSHYKQWAANQASLKVALEEMDDLKSSVLSNMAASLCVDAADLNFFCKAYEEIAECRRAIRWFYPYGYYLDPKRDDGDKCQKFQLLLREANDSLKGLQDLVAEQNRLSLYLYDDAVRDACKALETQVMETTAEMRHKVEKLVKAAETDFQD